jgi:hypothetical protein
MKNSAFGLINGNDILKGILVAFLTAFVTGLYRGIEMGTFDLTWLFLKPLVLGSVGSMLAYIIKNWLTNSDDKILKAE